MNGVRVSPGATQLTVIPCWPSGLASERAIPINAALLTTVGEEVGGRRPPDRVRGDEHDAAKAALRHRRREHLAQPQCRLDVDRLNAPPGREVEIGQRRAVERGGGVDEHVPRSEPLGDPAHRRLIAEVNRELPLAVEDRHLVPGRGQRADDRPADSAGAAGHHRSLHASSLLLPE